MKREIDPVCVITITFKEYERLLGIEKAWKRAMAELNKSIKSHKYYYAEAQLKEFSRTMKKIRKQCTKKKKEEE